MDLNQELSALQTELKGFVTKAAEEKGTFGTMLSETKTAVENLQKQIDAVDVKLADKSVAQAAKPFAESLKENEDVARIIRNTSGRATLTVKRSDLFEAKTVITSAAVGASTSGVLQIDRVAGITEEARQGLKLRNLLTSRPTSLQLVDFVRVNSALAAGAMVPEGTAVPENAVTFAPASEKVRTIATFLPATRQILADFTELGGFIQSSLPYYVNLQEELQLLSGDGTGENLHGLIPQATAYGTAANVTGDTKIDTIGHALSQIASSKELDPTFIVLNTADWWKIRLTKDAHGRYILGDPQANVTPSLFGVTVVPTTTIAANSFLIGTGVAPAAEIRDREDITVEISTEHADYFQKGLVAIRAEKRLALLVKRPGAFVTGTFPAAS